jgi:DNA adenine methylase
MLNNYPRPFLKWVGGKNKLIPQYQPYVPQNYSTYHEPFLGGGALFFHLLPHRAILSDINEELVNVYQCVRDRVDELIPLLQEHRDRHSYDHYYSMRKSEPISSVERAARFIYLNKTCFNGLYRENSKGLFNVPMGRYKNPRIFDPDLLKLAAIALKNASIQVDSFGSILERAKSTQDFVYFDPPYAPISDTSDFTGYTRHPFLEEEQNQLRDTFIELSRRGVKVMLSNSDCPFIRDLYQGFNIHSISAPRSINSKAQQRGVIPEVLITSY